MFESLIVQPIFNLLVFIYAILPGGNFGLSVIVFTVLVRFLILPLVRKQLHQTRAMRKLQPEIKKIKKAAKGNRQQESTMLMELYKERGINPFSSIGTLIIQLVVFIGLYTGLVRIINDQAEIVNFAYSWLQGLPALQAIAENPDSFDFTLFGLVDLSRAAIGSAGFYIPAFILVVGSAVTQFFQSSQLMPKDENARGLKQILKDAQAGKQAEASETNAAVGQSMKYFIPFMIFFVTIGLASALSLYWFTSGLVAYWQQSRILKEDETEMEAIGAQPKSDIIEGEVVKKPSKQTTAKQSNKKATANKKKKSSSKSTKRRKK